MPLRRLAAPLLLGLSVIAALHVAARADGKNREEKLKDDRARVTAAGFWIYDDYEAARKEAQRTDKPLVVALRCIPCEQCVRLDEELVETDPHVKPLLEQFVRVRLIRTNGLDLSTFQFDTDQSSAVFLLRADGTIYGRYGTRSAAQDEGDATSVQGLAAALEKALEMHAAWPRDREALAAKRGPKPRVSTPERYPTLKDRYGPTLAKDGPQVPSCIHCHQIGDAERAEVLERGPLPEELFFPYPNPRALGLTLDPDTCATVASVAADTPAARAGFQVGDELLRLEGQPILSIADVQWMLHHTPARGATLEAIVRRGDVETTLAWKLAKGWRRSDDMSWRVSTWPLRQRALGGMRLETVDGALRVKHVGRFPPHDRAKKAGIRAGDVLISFDGEDGFAREDDLLWYAQGRAVKARTVPVVLTRGDRRLEIDLLIGP
ncbi:MAG: Trx7/PDZ domain-containing (seleno)protein [Planctomycetota bacterium]